MGAPGITPVGPTHVGPLIRGAQAEKRLNITAAPKPDVSPTSLREVEQQGHTITEGEVCEAFEALAQDEVAQMSQLQEEAAISLEEATVTQLDALVEKLLEGLSPAERKALERSGKSQLDQLEKRVAPLATTKKEQKALARNMAMAEVRQQDDAFTEDKVRGLLEKVQSGHQEVEAFLDGLEVKQDKKGFRISYENPLTNEQEVVYGKSAEEAREKVRDKLTYDHIALLPPSIQGPLKKQYAQKTGKTAPKLSAKDVVKAPIDFIIREIGSKMGPVRKITLNKSVGPLAGASKGTQARWAGWIGVGHVGTLVNDILCMKAARDLARVGKAFLHKAEVARSKGNESLAKSLEAKGEKLLRQGMGGMSKSGIGLVSSVARVLGGILTFAKTAGKVSKKAVKAVGLAGSAIRLPLGLYNTGKGIRNLAKAKREKARIKRSKDYIAKHVAIYPGTETQVRLSFQMYGIREQELKTKTRNGVFDTVGGGIGVIGPLLGVIAGSGAASFGAVPLVLGVVSISAYLIKKGYIKHKKVQWEKLQKDLANEHEFMMTKQGTLIGAYLQAKSEQMMQQIHERDTPEGQERYQQRALFSEKVIPEVMGISGGEFCHMVEMAVNSETILEGAHLLPGIMDKMETRQATLSEPTALPMEEEGDEVLPQSKLMGFTLMARQGLSPEQAIRRLQSLRKRQEAETDPVWKESLDRLMEGEIGRLQRQGGAEELDEEFKLELKIIKLRSKIRKAQGKGKDTSKLQREMASELQRLSEMITERTA